MSDAIRVRYTSEIFARQRRGGASRMFAELLDEFTRRPELGVRPVVGPWLHRNDYLAATGIRGVRHVREGWPGDHPGVLRAANRWLERRGGRDTDLFHPTYYDPRHLRRADRTPMVTTVLDMIPELLPDQVRVDSHEAKLELVAASDLVVCISAAVRTELLQVAGDPGVPVVTCPLGVRPGDEAVPPIEDRPADPPIVLFVGARAGYKRFDVLLAALRLEGVTPIEVVCVGGGPWTDEERAAIDGLPAGVSVRRVESDDRELARWYRRARLLVSCSAGEGFGLPVLEAIAAGCPVVVSDLPVHREVSGGVGRFVPVGDAAALRDALSDLLGDPGLAGSLAVRGREVAATATWARSAELLAEAYHSIR